MESVWDILERFCPCGGDPSGLMHQESLLHREWLLGRAVINDREIVLTRKHRDFIDAARSQTQLRDELL